MSIARTILGEFNHEMANTRKVLERIPEEQAAWRPHPRSYSLGDLALHLSNIPTWVGIALRKDEWDANPPDGEKGARRAFDTRNALLKQFDHNVAEAVAVIADTSDEEMRKPWTLKNRGAVVFRLPRTAGLRSFVMNHLIHHRGQLTVYLRLKNVPLPAIYGGTADEK